MPRPMTGDDGGRHHHAPEAAPGVPVARDDAERDRSGRELAIRLPEWDLVPPTEFLDRSGRR